MNLRPQLVLDAGGVLVSDLKPLFWQELAQSAGISHEQFIKQFKQQIRADLWKGAITENGFWQWLYSSYPTIDCSEAKFSLIARMHLLPAVDHLEQWGQSADLHLLSNHRAEWLKPALSAVASHFSSMTISSDVGCSKPELPIYQLVHKKLLPDAEVLFVDDQPKNMPSAAIMGWQIVTADPAGNWIQTVNSFMNRRSI